jgi:WD40 repeat protein
MGKQTSTRHCTGYVVVGGGLGDDKTVRLWRLADNTCTAVLKEHTNSVYALACTPDGATLASGSTDNTVRLWRLADNTCTAVLEGHTSSVYALACTPDGATLASGSDDNTVRLWRLADNTCTAVLEGHTNAVRALACTPDGATLASGSNDNTVRLWRLADPPKVCCPSVNRLNLSRSLHSLHFTSLHSTSRDPATLRCQGKGAGIGTAAAAMASLRNGTSERFEYASRTSNGT